MIGYVTFVMDGRVLAGRLGEVREVVRACAERSVPIRIGVNGGSLEKELLEKYGHPSAEAMVEAGVSMGLPRPVAEKLAYNTIEGSARMLNELDEQKAIERVKGGLYGTSANLQPGHPTLENSSNDVRYETVGAQSVT